jgi:hypothetical protein
MEASSQLTAPAALLLEKELPFSVEKEARWTPELVGRFGEQKSFWL